jgi:ubiquinone/menaquinone biosynthesis C-methylase UbiE
MNEAETFLLDFHRLYPGCTSQAFAEGRRDSAGTSSYQLLAELAEGEEVLDLGSGDGHLLGLLARAPGCKRSTGIDFSPDELALARKASPVQALVRGRAQQLPFVSGAFSLVVSHFAFHLMSDPPLLVSELGRVLRPSGRFAAIVGGGPKVGDPFEIFLDLLLAGRADHHQIPRIGHKDTRTNEGLLRLFSESAHFENELEIDEYYIDFGGTFEQVWARASTVYDLVHFSPKECADLRERFRLALGGSAEQIWPCTMAIRRIVATRRPPGRAPAP